MLQPHSGKEVKASKETSTAHKADQDIGIEHKKADNLKIMPMSRFKSP
jgi:hypothetical protein